jgi:[acyl-carrier-protein] S-malonyltransferase
MQTAAPSGIGAMAALIGGTDDQAKFLVEFCADGEILDVANFNSPGQVVISGHSRAVQRAIEKSKEFGFKKAMPLNVSAPFHSRLMEPVRKRFEDELKAYVFSTPACPVVHNVTASANLEPRIIPGLLARQIDSPVRWTESVEHMVRDGVEVFIEVGHGSVLQGLVKKIVGRDWGGEILGIESPDDVDKVIQATR